MPTIDYRPAPTIKRFLASEHRENWMVGPVGGGKTVGALFKIAYHAARQKKGPDGIRHSRAVVVRSTMPQLKDTTIKSWFAWFKDGHAGQWHATDHRFMLKFNDVECEVLFRPLDTPDDVARVLSLEITFAVIDEFIHIPREIIEALAGRLGRYPAMVDGGPSWHGMWGVSNVGNRTNWWYDYLFTENTQPKDDLERVEWRVDGKTPSGRDIGVFEQPSGFSEEAENIDFLPGGKDYYPRLAENKTRHWVRQYIECQWGFDVSGEVVFQSFNPDIHVKRIKPFAGIPIALGYDPGMNCALTFGQYDLDGRLLIFEECGGAGYGTERFFKTVVIPRLRMRYAHHAITVIPDPYSRSRAQSNEQTALKALKAMGFNYDVPKTNLIRPRLEAVNYFLEQNGPRGPSFLIHPDCRMTVEALQGGYRYTERKKHDEDPEPEKNQWSHYADSVQYLAWHFRHGIQSQIDKRPGPKKKLPVFRNNYSMGT